MKKVFVYKLDRLIAKDTNHASLDDLKVIKWEPGFKNFVPPNSPFAYISFWFMHYLKIFKNRDYCAYVIYKGNVAVSSLVCVPSLYRWPFMEPKDLQIKNVFTHPDYRGKGLAYRLVSYAIERIGVEDRSFWYMTDEKNIPSQKLCEKIGFKFLGEYRRRRNKFLVYQGEIISE